MKPTARIVIILVALGIVAAGGYYGYRWFENSTAEQVSQTSVSASYSYRVVTASIGADQFALLVADTPEKQQLGLGKRQTLPAKQGMVVPYAEASEGCVWMKDMNFSIDVLWLDAAKQIVHVQPKLAPNTYPQTFCSPVPAQYIVELTPGTVERLRLRIGDSAVFEL